MAPQGHVPLAIIPGSRFDVSLTLFTERSYLNIVPNELHRGASVSYLHFRRNYVALCSGDMQQKNLS